VFGKRNKTSLFSPDTFGSSKCNSSNILEEINDEITFCMGKRAKTFLYILCEWVHYSTKYMDFDSNFHLVQYLSSATLSLLHQMN